VEVPLCEESANPALQGKIGSISGCLWSLFTGFLLPSKAVRAETLPVTGEHKALHSEQESLIPVDCWKGTLSRFQSDGHAWSMPVFLLIIKEVQDG
jgi:hypothetical protein